MEMETQDLRELLYGESQSQGESDEEEEDFLFEEMVEDNLTCRQLSYPPIPIYNTPIVTRDVKDKLGLLTPMQELSESDDEQEEKGSRHPSQNSHYNNQSPQNEEEEENSGFQTPTNNNNNSRKVSFNRNTPIEIPRVEVENCSSDRVVPQSQQEHLRWGPEDRHQLSQSPDEVWDFLDSSEMDSSAITKSLKSIPSSLLPLTIQAMSNSLTTLRHQLSTLNAISLFGDRLRELQPYETQDLDLSHIIKKLCTMIGESRTPEASLTLSRLIRGAGPSLVTSDLLHIINGSSNKRKAPAIDGLTYALLTFPRDEFQIERIAESVCICLWNPKRRIRQAALECLALIAHVLGPGLAMPFIRELIDENRPPPPIGNPSSAVSARVSRRLLPSPSPVGLVDYALPLPSKQQLDRLRERGEEDPDSNQELDPILNRKEFGADVLWIIHGATGTRSGTEMHESDWSSNERNESSANSSKSSSRGSRKSDKKYGPTLDRQELKPQVLFSEEQEEDEHAGYFQVRRSTETKANVYNLESVKDEVLEIRDEDHEDEEGEEQDDYSEKKSLGGGRDRDSGLSSLKSFRVTSPNGVEDYPNTPPPQPYQNVQEPDPESPPQTEQSPVSSAYIIRKPVMVRASGNGKTKSPINAPESESPSNPENQAQSIGTSSSRSSTGSSPSLTHVPKKSQSVSSRPRLKNYMEAKAGSTNSTAHVFAPDLPPLANPSHGLSKGLNDLNSSDWETNVEGFRVLVALLRHHPQYIQSDLHNINMAGIKHLGNLRSQVSRAACLFFKEMFCQLGKLMELDVEKIGEKLLDKSADTNKFIRDSSCAALEAMVENLSPTKTIIPLENVGSKHRNSAVKTTTAKMSTVVIRKLGPEKCLTQMGDKILPMLVKFLQEGSLETRTYAKAAMSMLMSHGYFDTALRNHVPSDTLRHVIKTIDGIKKELLRKHSSRGRGGW